VTEVTGSLTCLVFLFQFSALQHSLSALGFCFKGLQESWLLEYIGENLAEVFLLNPGCKHTPVTIPMHIAPCGRSQTLSDNAG
jgi:hypothetical protein